MRAYISGPISGVPNGNKPAFEKGCYHAINQGYWPMNPHTLGEHVPSTPGWETFSARRRWREYMRVCLVVIPDCQMIVMLRG